MSENATAPASKVTIGSRFGMLVVLDAAGRREFPCGGSQAVFLCECDCGVTVQVLAGNLRQGKSKSCGCRKLKHGRCYSRAYRAHNGMMMRCHNPNTRFYPSYGGRGITVAPEWHSFEAFYRDMGDPPERASLERIDNDKGYSKENCVWASSKVQGNNKRSNVRISFAGQTRTLMQWCEATGIPYSTLHGRLRAGMSLDRVFSPKPLWQR